LLIYNYIPSRDRTYKIKKRPKKIVNITRFSKVYAKEPIPKAIAIKISLVFSRGLPP
jgi:hypothetical protein